MNLGKIILSTVLSVIKKLNIILIQIAKAIGLIK
mgnify:CR=1 FL=1